MRAHGMGAHVIVTEVNPTRALEALMDGYRVAALADAAREADLIITVTGNVHVLDRNHLANLKDGAILANAGHFNDEINIPALAEGATVRTVRDFVQEYRRADGRRVYLIAEGRLANISAAEGHPAAVMDMSFANQALSVEYLQAHAKTLAPGVYDVPVNIDREVAATKLRSLGVQIDTLTGDQEQYLASWQSGT
jgi:adenosylhomocysteinase